MQDIIEILYDNIVYTFVISIALFIIGFILVIFVIKKGIQTRVLVVRKTTAELLPAREDIGKGVIKFGKKTVLKGGEPCYIRLGLTPCRLYLHFEGDDKVVSPARESDLNIPPNALQNILEEQVIAQMVAGLTRTKRELIFLLLAGATVGFFISQILFLLGG